MTTELPLEILDALVGDYAGPGTRHWRLPPGNNSPMGVVLETARRFAQTTVEAYWVEGGMPEMFSLPALSPPVVAFNSRYLELSAYMLTAYNNRIFSDHTLATAARRIGADVIAELTLGEGDAEASCYMLCYSLVDSDVEVLPSSRSDLENLDMSEQYMCLWFLALLHEVGHVAVEFDGKASVVSVDEEGALGSVNARIHAVLEQIPGSRDLYDRLTASGEYDFASTRIDGARLAVEVNSDCFAVQALISATAEIAQRDDTFNELNIWRLVDQINLMFAIYYWMSMCGLAAERMTLQERGASGQPDAWHQPAMSVRMSFLVDFLARVVAFDGTQYPAEEKVIAARDRILQIVATQAGRHRAFSSGVEESVAHALHPARREPLVYARLAQSLADGTLNPAAITRAQRFLKRAADLGLEHSDLDMLREMIDEPTTALEILGGRVTDFFTVWVGDPQTGGYPFMFGGAHQVAAPVFRNKETLAAFLELIRDKGPHEWESIQLVTIQAATAVGVIAVMHILAEDVLPGKNRLQIIVEGTSEFDRGVAELHDLLTEA